MSEKWSRRGSVLLEVLVIGVIVAFIAAGTIAIIYARYMATNRIQEQSQNTRIDEGGFNRLLYSWNSAANGSGQVCASLAGVYSCSGSAGTCGCTCNPTSLCDPKVTTAPGAGVCDISAKSPDPKPAGCP